MLLKDFSKKLEDFEQYNPFSFFYEFGMSPDDIKQNIIYSFNEYFQNPTNLEEHAIKDMVSCWLSYLTIQRDHAESIELIKAILDIFNDAKKINEEQTIKAYISWFTDLNQSISRFWSIYNSQYDTTELCIEDFLEETLSSIGQFIEGLSKPFFKLLLHLNRIKRNKPVDFVEIQSKDLGIVIDELINTSNLSRLLILEPNAIRLNQWRNIAYHHNTKIVNEKIFCSFKKNGVSEEFSISRTELLKVLKKTSLIFKLIRIAETIFCIDNLPEIKKAYKNITDSQMNYREEAKLLDFTTPIASQGFTVTNLIFDQNVAIMDVRDKDEYADFIKKAIHSSQFLYNLWLFTESSKLIINYSLFSGEKFFTSEIDSASFLNCSTEEAEISELLKDVKFSFISKDYRQNKDPFKDLVLASEIIEDPQIFFSQQGDKISIKEFIRQFSLSVFCNYLIAKSESLEGIRINIGSDGSLTITEKPQSIILHIPAKISNKALQLKLLELLNQLIELYEKKELIYEIVRESKIQNGFFHKKALIKEQLKL